MRMKQKKKILIVDDDIQFAGYIALLLANSGFLPRESYGWSHMREVIKEEAIDAIILDMILPDKHGLTVLSELKAWERAKHIPIVVLSSMDNYAYKQEAQTHGAVEYLVKGNCSPEDVLTVVSKALAPI